MAFEPATVTEESSLGRKQELFVFLEAQWVGYAFSRGYVLRHGEGRILPRGPDGAAGRKARHLLTGLPLRVEDAVHMRGGTHYLGTGADWNLFVDGVWVSAGSHPAWKDLGETWEKMHPLCRWGGRFQDDNHISITHGGKS